MEKNLEQIPLSAKEFQKLLNAWENTGEISEDVLTDTKKHQKPGGDMIKRFR
jgi:hypothetical protein